MIEPGPQTAADRVGAPAIGEIGAVAGDLGDQHGVLRADPGVLDQDRLHPAPFVVADPAVGPGDTNEHEGQGVEVVDGLAVEGVESVDGVSNRHGGFDLGVVGFSLACRWIHGPLHLLLRPGGGVSCSTLAE